MRGAPVNYNDPITLGRIIPADAGSTDPGASGNKAVEDHPRGCGEHFFM